MVREKFLWDDVFFGDHDNGFGECGETVKLLNSIPRRVERFKCHEMLIKVEGVIFCPMCMGTLYRYFKRIGKI